MEFRTYWTNRPPVDEGGVACTVDEGMARQEFVEECDLNRMMAKYLRTGIGFPVRDAPELYGDFSQLGDYQAAQDMLLRAREQFEALPSSMRDRFGNDPVGMLRFLEDEGNREEAIKLGLVKAPDPVPAPAKPIEVVVVDGAKFNVPGEVPAKGVVK